jgi:hypothetical protein
VQAVFDQYFVELYPHGKIIPHADREGARLLEKTHSLEDRARAYADSLLAAVSPAQRIEFACAPPKTSRALHGDFDPRFPALVEERHGPYVGIVRGFSFGDCNCDGTASNTRVIPRDSDSASAISFASHKGLNITDPMRLSSSSANFLRPSVTDIIGTCPFASAINSNSFLTMMPHAWKVFSAVIAAAKKEITP